MERGLRFPPVTCKGAGPTACGNHAPQCHAHSPRWTAAAACAVLTRRCCPRPHPLRHALCDIYMCVGHGGRARALLRGVATGQGHDGDHGDQGAAGAGGQPPACHDVPARRQRVRPPPASPRLAACPLTHLPTYPPHRATLRPLCPTPTGTCQCSPRSTSWPSCARRCAPNPREGTGGCAHHAAPHCAPTLLATSTHQVRSMAGLRIRPFEIPEVHLDWSYSPLD